MLLKGRQDEEYSFKKVLKDTNVGARSCNFTTRVEAQHITVGLDDFIHASLQQRSHFY